MELEELQKNWDRLAQTYPLWAVFGWQQSIDKLLLIGEREIDVLMAYIRSLGLDIPQGVALDFGCGVGRLTQPLARYFDEVYGLDIAPTMIDLANQYNRYGDKCHYILNENKDLALFSDDSINFIYSAVTFQNIAPYYTRKYIQEFLRILVPNGLLIFEIPSEPQSVRQRMKKIIPARLLNLYYQMKYQEKPRIELHGIKREEVIQFLRELGARIIDIKKVRETFEDWTVFQYCVTKE